MSEPRYTAINECDDVWVVRHPNDVTLSALRFYGPEGRDAAEHLANAMTLGMPKEVPMDEAVCSEFPGMPPRESSPPAGDTPHAGLGQGHPARQPAG